MAMQNESIQTLDDKISPRITFALIPKTSRLLKKHRLLLAAIIFLILSSVIAGPIEIYPLNDEWAYGEPIKSWLETGQMVFPSTTALSIGPVFFGCLLTKLCGFSYLLLRLFSLVCGILACLFLYLTLRNLGLSKDHSGIFSIVLGSSPMVINLSNTFMSDIPAMSFFLATSYFVLRAIRNRKDSFRRWIAVLICLILAVSTRQTCLSLLAGLFALAIFRQFQQKQIFAPMITASVSVPVYLAATAFVKAHCMYTQPAEGYQQALLQKCLGALGTPTESFQSLIYCCGYIGLFMLPLTFPIFFSLTGRKNGKISTFLTILTSLPFLDLVFRQKQLMPWSPNLFCPPLLGAYALIGEFPKPGWLNVCLWGITLLTIFGAPMALVLLCSSSWQRISCLRKQNGESEFAIFLLTATFVNVSFLIVQLSISNLDRYFVSVFAPALILTGLLWRDLPQKPPQMAPVLLAMLIGLAGIVELTDNHLFQRNKEKCIRFLLNRNVKPTMIDGGPEFNLISNFSLLSSYKFNLENPELSGYDIRRRGSTQTQNLRWWPVSNEDYIISTKPLPGYTTVFASRYWSPIFCTDIHTLCLKRNSDSIKNQEPRTEVKQIRLTGDHQFLYTPVQFERSQKSDLQVRFSCLSGLQ